MQNPGAASFAWHWEALERSEERPRLCLDMGDQQTDLSVCFFVVVFSSFFFFFLVFKNFPLSYAMVIRNIVIKQQV